MSEEKQEKTFSISNNFIQALGVAGMFGLGIGVLHGAQDGFGAFFISSAVLCGVVWLLKTIANVIENC